jgi:hypothetical protein
VDQVLGLLVREIVKGCSTTIVNFRIALYGLRLALLLRSVALVSVTASIA